MIRDVHALAVAAVRDLNADLGAIDPPRRPKPDGCPNACRGVLAEPYTWRRLGGMSYRGWYRCSKCSREWFTSWRLG